MENDISTGAPIGIVIPNADIEDVQIEKHRSYKDLIRPGQAAYTYFKKYGENLTIEQHGSTLSFIKADY